MPENQAKLDLMCAPREGEGRTRDGELMNALASEYSLSHAKPRNHRRRRRKTEHFSKLFPSLEELSLVVKSSLKQLFPLLLSILIFSFAGWQYYEFILLAVKTVVVVVA